MNITAYQLAKGTLLSQTRIGEIIEGKRRITADTALRFSRDFGTTPSSGWGFQDDFDLEQERERIRDTLESIAARKVS